MIEITTPWLVAHPLPNPGEHTDKNKRGRVFMIGGSESAPGGILLAGEAAFRAGAGKVQLGTVEGAALSIAVRLPESAVYGLPANSKGELTAKTGSQVAAMLDQCDAVVIGPGMGPGAAAATILSVILAGARQAAVLIDAVAIGEASSQCRALRKLGGGAVLTPHFGEMARLMERDEKEIADNPTRWAREAAERFSATVVLKGSETWIATANGDVLHYAGGGSGLATGGSGDILAGVIGGLLSRGAEPQLAAVWGVWLHGEAGRIRSREMGPLGFLARELLAEIPRLMCMPGVKAKGD